MSELMAVQVIYSTKRQKEIYPDHFEIIKELDNLDDRMLARLYNDPSLKAENFKRAVKKHNPDIGENDRIYFYTNQFRPSLITDDDF